MLTRTLKSIIIEDEILSANLLKSIITEYSQGIEVIEIIGDIPNAIESISRTKPDIVFLDIELNGKNSFEILDHFPALDFKIIVTSGHEQYAFQAFQHKVTDYLLKPYRIDELIKSLEKVKHDLSLDIIDTSYHGTFAIPGPDGIELLNYNEIIRLEADGMYCHVILKNKQKRIVSKPLGTIENHLPENIFIRVHHSHLININYLLQYTKGATSALVMEDGSVIPISKRKKKDVLKSIKKL